MYPRSTVIISNRVQTFKKWTYYICTYSNGTLYSKISIKDRIIEEISCPCAVRYPIKHCKCSNILIKDRIIEEISCPCAVQRCQNGQSIVCSILKRYILKETSALHLGSWFCSLPCQTSLLRDHILATSFKISQFRHLLRQKEIWILAPPRPLAPPPATPFFKLPQILYFPLAC